MISIYAQNSYFYPVTTTVSFRGIASNVILNKATMPVTLMPGETIRTQRSRSAATIDNLIPWVREIGGSLEVSSNEVYSLPCSYNTGCLVSQTDGDYTHDSWDKYAVDFDFPEGSPAFSISKGIVIDAYEASSTNCNTLSKACDKHLNKLVVMTDDGAIVEYLQLKKTGFLNPLGKQLPSGSSSETPVISVFPRHHIYT